MEILIGGIIGIILGVIFFAPTLISIRKRKEFGTKKVLIVYIINFFLGWTILGWAIALSMAIENKH